METPFPHDPAAAERAVAMLKTLSHAGRLRILCHLIDGDMNVGELSDALHEAQASVSQQLMRLRAEGFVRPLRTGKRIIYTLGRTEIVPVIAALRHGVCAAPDSNPPHPSPKP